MVIIPIGQKNDREQPSRGSAMYGCSVGEPCRSAQGMPSSVVEQSESSAPCGNGESGGKDKALAVGCNANNRYASARTANCNNAASNGNNNNAGAFAVTQGGNNGISLTSRPTRSNTANDRTATGGCGSADYELPPFWGDDNAEMLTSATHEGIDSSILDELKTAIHKRKLKSLKRYITNPTIIRMGVERCLSRASNSPEVRDAIRNKEAIIRRITEELTNETYRCSKPKRRVILKKGKGDKDRNADVFSVYDRCVQNILLIVLREKLVNKIPRWCYSGIEGRSLWSNNKTYCMVNQIRTYVKNHPTASVGLTDIRHFYESLSSKVVLGILFETIVCPYTRRLLCDILLQTDNLVIGGTLSQLFAMLVLADMDNELVSTFHPQFYGTFGDNRIIMDTDRKKVSDAVHWEMSYLEGRYGMTMKNDWQILRAEDGFMFCKQHFHGSFVNVRAELRRRAVRASKRGQQHYAGYLGMLQKTDSRRLIRMIEYKEYAMKNQKGMAVKPMAGDPIKLSKVEGRTIYITDYSKRSNNKDSEYFIRFQFVAIEDDSKKHLYVTNNGSYEIKEFFKLVADGAVSLPLKTKVCADGCSYYFEQFHTTAQEACELICKELGI